MAGRRRRTGWRAPVPNSRNLRGRFSIPFPLINGPGQAQSRLRRGRDRTRRCSPRPSLLSRRGERENGFYPARRCRGDLSSARYRWNNKCWAPSLNIQLKTLPFIAGPLHPRARARENYSRASCSASRCKLLHDQMIRCNELNGRSFNEYLLLRAENILRYQFDNQWDTIVCCENLDNCEPVMKGSNANNGQLK